VIRAHDIGQVVAVFDVTAEVFAYEKVVDSPADVSLAGTGSLAPPSVVVWFFVELAEAVDVAVGDEFVHPSALDRQKAGDVFVFFWTGEVDGSVGCVYIAGDDEVFAFLYE